MMTRSSSLRYAFAFAFSFSVAVSSPLLPFPPRSSSLKAPSSLPLPRKKVAADLLSLLGSGREAARVAPNEADQLKSCFKFLVPFDPTPRSGRVVDKRSYMRELSDRKASVEDLVWWPPEPVMELARIAVDSGGDPAAIQRELDPTMWPVPDVEGCKDDGCQLTSTPYGRRFICKELNSYFALLFEAIVSRGPSVGLNVTLSRYDLFHGHIFLATGSGRLGILFHAKEYPRYDKEVFPLNMGYCQKGSNVAYDESINLRNILWLAPLPSNETRAWLAPGVLVVLDAHPNGIIYKDLIPEYVDYVRTIYEDDFGDHVADVNYLNVNNVASGERIFIC